MKKYKYAPVYKMSLLHNFPRYETDNLYVKQFYRVNALFQKYCFFPAYFDNCQCKAEVIVLATSLFSYLNEFEKPEDQNPDTVAFLLRQIDIDMYNPEQENNIDKVFYEVAKEGITSLALDCYKTFKLANASKKRDAVLALSEYYLYGVYTIEDIVISYDGEKRPDWMCGQWIEKKDSFSDEFTNETFLKFNPIDENERNLKEWGGLKK